MSLRDLIPAWLDRRTTTRVEGDTASPTVRLCVLNSMLGLPTSCSMRPYQGSEDADRYFFEYNYIDRTKTLRGLAALAEVAATRQLDFSGKTLLLAAKGLHPMAAELIELTQQFRTHHLFFELWNGLKEVVELADARIEHLYFLPVTTRLRQVSAARVPATANRRVFVSLGGDDDLELIRAVIARAPHLHFCVPTVSWAKPGSDKHFADVRIAAPNVTAVDCAAVQHTRQLLFSPDYRTAYESCDTVLIATLADKMFQLRGGVRFADALYARKHIVITENPMCQLLMAQHEQSCLVAEHDAAAVVDQLTRIGDGRFQVDERLYEDIRELTVEEHKLAWMIRAAGDPEAARRSVFARGPIVLEVARRMLFARGARILDREVNSVRGHGAGRAAAERPA